MEVPTDGVDVLLDALLPRVKDDSDARQEFLDLLETLGPDDQRTAPLPQGTGRPAVLNDPPGPRVAVPGATGGRAQEVTEVASAVVHLELGDRRYDLATRALVMGIVNRTPIPSTTGAPPMRSTPSSAGSRPW